MSARSLSLPFGEGAAVRSEARLSPCGLYRYWLLRAWGPGPRALFCALNPSIADASLDDPTIRRCVGFARSWGYDGIEVVNLFAWRATDPDDLWAQAAAGVDVVGPENDAAITEAAGRAGVVIATWGEQGKTKRQREVMRLRTEQVIDRLARMADVHCLAQAASGAPRHPLYLRGDLRPVLLRAKEISNA